MDDDFLRAQLGRIPQLEAERDCYREALQWIDSYGGYAELFGEAAAMRRIAHKALSDASNQEQV